MLQYELYRGPISGSLWANSYNESINGKLRDELLDGEIFSSMIEAKMLIEHCRKRYNVDKVNYNRANALHKLPTLRGATLVAILSENIVPEGAA